MVSDEKAASDIIDHLRHFTNTPQFASRPSNTTVGILEALCAWPSADSNTVMRLLGDSRDTNARMEGCLANGGLYAWKRGVEPCVHAGISQSPAGRSYRRT